MTKDKGIPKSECQKDRAMPFFVIRAWKARPRLRLRYGSFIRHSSFVIRHFSLPMKNLLRSRLPILLLSALFAFSACHGKRLTKANVDEVSQGMSRKQVESILGPPTSIDSTNL